MMFFQYLKPDEKIFIALFIVLKIAVLLLLPLTGDEAYFITWGQDLSLGYYDHPPVVGWVIYLLSFIQDHYFVYRAFAFLVSIVIAVTLYQLVLGYKDKETAFSIALIFFVSPLSLFFIMLTNDVVLLLFGFTGFYFLSKAFDKSSIGFALLAGVLLGLAFLSKYLSIIMLLALGVYAIVHQRKQLKLVIIISFMIILLALENLYFNINSCWNNIVFNLVARTSESTFNPESIYLFIISILILVPPYGLYLIATTKAADRHAVNTQAAYVLLFSFCVFAFVSTFKTIGLHWLALYIPFAYLLFSNIPSEKLSALLRYNAIASIFLAIGLIIISTQYATALKNQPSYQEVFLYTDTPIICAALPANKTVFTINYSINSILTQHCKNNQFHVISNTSKYGREDDKKINFSDYDNRELLVFTTNAHDANEISPYFNSTETMEIDIHHDIKYYLIKANGFNFQLYKQSILQQISKQFYAWPEWLPEAKCGFNTKYAL